MNFRAINIDLATPNNFTILCEELTALTRLLLASINRVADPITQSALDLWAIVIICIPCAPVVDECTTVRQIFVFLKMRPSSLGDINPSSADDVIQGLGGDAAYDQQRQPQNGKALIFFHDHTTNYGNIHS